MAFETVRSGCLERSHSEVCMPRMLKWKKLEARSPYQLQASVRFTSFESLLVSHEISYNIWAKTYICVMCYSGIARAGSFGAMNRTLVLGCWIFGCERVTLIGIIVLVVLVAITNTSTTETKCPPQDEMLSC